MTHIEASSFVFMIFIHLWRVGHAEARNLDLHWGLPLGWQELKYLVHFLLSSQVCEHGSDMQTKNKKQVFS